MRCVVYSVEFSQYSDDHSASKNNVLDKCVAEPYTLQTFPILTIRLDLQWVYMSRPDQIVLVEARYDLHPINAAIRSAEPTKPSRHHDYSMATFPDASVRSPYVQDLCSKYSHFRYVQNGSSVRWLERVLSPECCFSDARFQARRLSFLSCSVQQGHFWIYSKNTALPLDIQLIYDAAFSLTLDIACT